MADMYLGESAETGQVAGNGVFGVLFNWLGAIMSVALIGGLAVWGYQLAMRDVTGVPVVRALEGPMRVAPDDPGGERAAYQGLAVNSVAADGVASAPADRLILAPAPLDLTDEDLPRAQLAEAGAAQPAAVAQAGETAPGQGDVLALTQELPTGVTPLSATISTPTASSSFAAAVIPATVAGVARSPFPMPRPLGDSDPEADAVARSVALAIGAASSLDVDPESLPVGTRLVQFGAFDSPAAARREWDRLDARFTDFLAEKQRVIQMAVSGGKTFYRLRAVGFDDINDARRFCSALLAERQACIPVVTR